MSTLRVTGSASSGLEPAGYTIHDRVYYGPCNSCGESHGNGTPCRDTEYKQYWEHLGLLVKALLGYESDA